MGHLVERHGAGVQVALDVERVAEVFRELASHPREYLRYAEGVLELRETLQWDKVAVTYLAAYRHIMDDARRAARF
jgi:hypothetical protein